MKNTKLLKAFISLTPLVGVFSISTTISCGNLNKFKFSKYTEEMYDQSLIEFVGEDYKGGICKIARPSFNLDAIREYLTNEITALGISVSQDDYKNMWFDLPATEGWENVKPLILQAHMDMVWSVDPDNPPQELYPIPVHDVIDGKEVIHTKEFKSSLGADNGQGLAIILSLAKNKKIPHGLIRCIITADEEPGCVGAGELGKIGHERIEVIDHQQGFDYLINLDNETIGQMCLSTAGGYSCKYITNEFETIDAQTLHQYKLEIDNGLGGHSGLAMKENHMNAIKSANSALVELSKDKEVSIQLISINSYTNASNVVPGKATVEFAADKELANLDDIANSINAAIQVEHPKETNLTCSLAELTSAAKHEKCIPSNDSNALMNLIDSIDYGVKEWRPDHSDLASSSNLSPLMLDLSDTADNNFTAEIYSRSETQTDLEYYRSAARSNFDAYKASLTSSTAQTTSSINKIADYPPYVAKENDLILAKARQLFKKMGVHCFDVRPHAGSEVSWFAQYNPFLNQTMVGPNIANCHVPTEKLDLKSYKQVIDTVIKMILWMKTI